MWRIINYKLPEDFVLATGKVFQLESFRNSIQRNWCNSKWKGKGLKEKGYDYKNNKVLLK